MKTFERGSRTFQNTTLPYRIFIPKDYDSNKSYPLMLCLHGAGERGTDNETHIRKHDLATPWAKPSNQEKHPCFVVAPQCPKKMKWNYVHFRKGSFSMDTLAVGKEMLTVIDLLNKLIKKYSINENRLYLTGLSMGGYATWDIITRYPDKFAAAIPMSGAGDPTKANSYKTIPIWNFHNTNDKIVPVKGSRDMVNAMDKAGIEVIHTLGLSNDKLNTISKKMKHLYTESQTGNHGPWEPWYNDPKLHNWVFSQSK